MLFFMPDVRIWGFRKRVKKKKKEWRAFRFISYAKNVNFSILVNLESVLPSFLPNIFNTYHFYEYIFFIKIQKFVYMYKKSGENFGYILTYRVEILFHFVSCAKNTIFFFRFFQFTKNSFLLNIFNTYHFKKFFYRKFLLVLGIQDMWKKMADFTWILTYRIGIFCV